MRIEKVPEAPHRDAVGTHQANRSSAWSLWLFVVVVVVVVVGVSVPGWAASGYEVPAGFPSAGSTGPVDEGALVVLDEGTALETTHDGEVLENFVLSGGSITVLHRNVTIRNFRIDLRGGSQFAAIVTAYWVPTDGLVVEDGEITSTVNGAGAPTNASGVQCDNCMVRRMEISWMENGIFSQGNATLTDNYIHHLLPLGSSHNDGIFVIGNNTVIRHNTILIPNQQTSAVNSDTFSGPVDGILVENNYLNGGAYTIFMREYTGNGISPTNVRIVNNVFGSNYVYGVLSSDSPDLVFENNVLPTEATTTTTTQPPAATTTQPAATTTPPTTVAAPTTARTDAPTRPAGSAYTFEFGERAMPFLVALSSRTDSSALVPDGSGAGQPARTGAGGEPETRTMPATTFPDSLESRPVMDWVVLALAVLFSLAAGKAWGARSGESRHARR